MIFVTVGTHEQPFNRLIKSVDMLKGEGKITEDVVLQIGYSTYEPQHCKWSKLMAHQTLTEYISNARIVITHGGPASIFIPLQMMKIPVVVPRQYCYHEHINNHQMDFVKKISVQSDNIIPVYDTDDLYSMISNYEQIAEKKRTALSCNNQIFNQLFIEMVDKLMKN